MPMTVDIKINGDTIHELTVRNLGHPSDGTHYYTDDLRSYEIKGLGFDAWLLHRRSDGAATLARKVLELVEFCKDEGRPLEDRDTIPRRNATHLSTVWFRDMEDVQPERSAGLDQRQVTAV